jgi:hypothetical protein
MASHSAKVAILEEIYGIVDLLIFKKYLDSIPFSHASVPRIKNCLSTSAKETNTNPMTNLKPKSELLHELNVLARETYGIHDLRKLEQAMDLYCSTKLKLLLVARDPLALSTRSLQALQQEEQTLDLSEVRILESFCQPSSLGAAGPLSRRKLDVASRLRISHFIENHHLYEKELKEKLGLAFQIPQTPNQIPQPPNQIPQSPNQISQTPNQISQTPNQIPQPQISQSPNQISQTPNQISQPSNQTPQPPHPSVDKEQWSTRFVVETTLYCGIVLALVISELMKPN